MRRFIPSAGCNVIQKASVAPEYGRARCIMRVDMFCRYSSSGYKPRRNGSVSNTSSKPVSPVFSPRDLSPRAIKSFDRNLPNSDPDLKAWEKEGLSKDQYFGRRYGRMSEPQKEKYNSRIQRQRDARKPRKIDDYDEQRSTRNSQGSRYRTSERSSPVEYVFGTHAVRLVLHARSRSFYGTLHTYRCKDLELVDWAHDVMGLKVVEADRPQFLKSLSAGGVHNGIVLETGPLVHADIHSLGRAQDGAYEVLTYHQWNDSVTKTTKSVRRGLEKFPLGVFLDGITDPQNLGGIARSAFFFGADFLVVPDENSARMGPVALKASAGALDLIPIYTVSQTAKFLARIQENGWNVVASGVADSVDAPMATIRKELNIEEATRNKMVPSEELGGMLEQCPMLLIMGSEGQGVSREIRTKADFLVKVDKQVDGDVFVDSLNVNVAAGVLLSKCVN